MTAIDFVNAISFCSKTVGARLGRCFWMLEKPVG